MDPYADFVARQPVDGPRIVGKHPALGLGYGEQPEILQESPPCQLFASRRIVVPSRRQRHRSRIITALSVLLALALLGAGMALQHRWDAQCERADPGTRWDGDLWACVSK